MDSSKSAIHILFGGVYLNKRSFFIMLGCMIVATVAAIIINTKFIENNDDYEPPIIYDNNQTQQQTIQQEKPTETVKSYNLDDFKMPEEAELAEFADGEPQKIYPDYWVDCEYEEYVVQPGNTYWSIGDKYYYDNEFGVPGGAYWKQIRYDNGLSGEELLIGQVLKIYPLDMEKIKKIRDEETKVEAKLNGPHSSVRNAPHEDIDGMTYMGKYKITGYDPFCAHCCGKSNGITSSGRVAEIGVTCALNGVKSGTILYIVGYGYYRVDDTGNMDRRTIDIACHDHSECYAITNFNGVDVYKVNQ